MLLNDIDQEYLFPIIILVQTNHDLIEYMKDYYHLLLNPYSLLDSLQQN
jgi:hypothetical protein